MKTNILILIAALFMLLAIPQIALADGMIIIDPRPMPPPPPNMPPPPVQRDIPLAIKFHHVTVDIKGTICITKVDQIFNNPNQRQVEGTYIFPIPPDASISQFSMFMGDKEVQGEILDREKARDIYEQIVRKMRDPALLEYIDRGLFKAQVFPIPANGEVHIKLSYQETLKKEAGLVRYRYPLNTEKFSSRPLDSVSIEVNMTSPVAITSVVSPSHKIDVAKKSAGEAKASYEEKLVKPDRDFYLYYTVSDKDFGLSADCFKPAGEDGFFYMMIAPAFEFKKEEVQPKDVIFVFDTSGSMQEMGKLEQQAKALKFCMNALDKTDRFNLVGFSTQARTFRDNLLPVAAENLKAAEAWIDENPARGGTDINEAILAALKMAPSDKGRLFMLVLITDGEPTLGVVKVEDILRNVANANAARVRLFTLGVGSELNVHLLDRLAQENFGASDYLDPKENIEIKISAFFEKIAYPVLSDATVTVKDMETFDVYPGKIGDVFKGQQITLLGRFKGEGAKAVVLKGTVAGKEKEYVFETTFKNNTESSYIPVLWAARKIAYLFDNIRLHGETKEVKDEIVKLSLKYGIMTPYTSYLVTEDAPIATGMPRPPNQPRPMDEERRDRIRGEMGSTAEAPAASDTGGGAAGAYGSRPGRKALDEKFENAMKPKGDMAIEYAKDHEKAKKEPGMTVTLDAEKEAEAAFGGKISQRVGDKAFYREKDVWVDATFDKSKAMPEVKVTAWSEDFFKLIREIPALGKFFAIGDKVTVVFDGKVYIMQ
jgi:Ca-activated chloride channel family protein